MLNLQAVYGMTHGYIAADLLEVGARAGLGLGNLRYQVYSRLSTWLR